MRQVKQEFHSSGFMCDVDLDPGCTLNKKIRNAQLAQYNFILGQQQQHALPSLPSVIPVLILFSLSVYILIFLSLSLSCVFVWKVVGEKEKTSNTVNVRTRDNKVHGERTVEECVERLKQLKTSKCRNAEEEF